MTKSFNYILIFILIMVIGFAIFQNYNNGKIRIIHKGQIDSLNTKNTFLVHNVQNLKIVNERLRKDVIKRDSIHIIKKTKDSIRIANEYIKLKKELLEKEPNDRVDFFLQRTSNDVEKIEALDKQYLIPLENIDSANMIILERDNFYNEISLLLSNELYLNTKIKDLGYIITNKDKVIEKLEELKSNNRKILNKKDLLILENEKVIKKQEKRMKLLYGAAALITIIAILK